MASGLEAKVDIKSLTRSYKGRLWDTRLVREASWVLWLLRESDPCRKPNLGYGSSSLL